MLIQGHNSIVLKINMYFDKAHSSLYWLLYIRKSWLNGWLYRDELVKRLVICCANGHIFMTIKVGYIFSLKFVGYVYITMQSWLTSWPYCRYPGYILLTIHANMVI